MNLSTQAIGHDLKTLADHARDLLSATADVAGDKVAEARKSLSSALESGKDMASHARDSAMRTAKSACDSARAHPYQALGIAIGVGALIVVATRLCTYRRD
jgi:ElaB/YqjD/DUF883 family membrane-anchored ribosome-binding protein